MTGRWSTSAWPGRVLVLVCILALPFVRFLLQNRYNLLRPEAGASIGLFVALSILIALACRRRLVFSAVCLLLIVLMSTGSIAHILNPYVHLRTRWVLVGFACLVALGMRTMREAFFTLVVVFSVGSVSVDVAQALFSSRPSMLIGSSRPVRNAPLSHVVYIVLDEHIGPGGLPRDIEECSAARIRIQNVLARHRFDIYPNAFSNYAGSMDSIPSILNLQLAQREWQWLREAPGENILKTNKLFSRFQAKGYEVLVFQSDFMTYCPPGLGCRAITYPANAITDLASVNLDWLGKLRLILRNYVQSDSVLFEIFQKFPYSGELGLKVIVPFSVYKVWPDAVAHAVLRAGRNTLFFAHLLIPHHPYVYGKSGALRDYSEWFTPPQFETSDPAVYTRQYRHYAEQVEYVSTELDRFLRTLEQSPSYDSTLIIIHGDHGSRLQLIDGHGRSGAADSAEAGQYENASPRQIQNVLNRYSTLLAVKRPGATQGRVVPTRASVLHVLSELLDPQLASRLPGAVDMAYSFDSAGRPHAIPILKLWNGESGGSN